MGKLQNKKFCFASCFVTLLLFSFFEKFAHGVPPSTYAISVGERDFERVQLLNNTYNPSTLEFLKEAGLKPGMTVLDLGCGVALIDCEIAKMVGPEGKIICLDISADQLEIAKKVTQQNQITNVEFVKLGVNDLTKINQKVDFIFCRFLLMHLDKVEKCLHQCYHVLKPGGKIAVFECLGNETMVCHPPVKGYDRFMDIQNKQFILQKTDPAIGYKLPMLLQKLGFKNLSYSLFHPILRGQNRKIWELDIHTLTPAFVKNGLETYENMQKIQDDMEELEKDESSLITYYEVIQIVAEKPQNETL
jgi:cyclopropane fatty-acyl-phospholipid synthase-like methyltransferase